MVLQPRQVVSTHQGYTEEYRDVEMIKYGTRFLMVISKQSDKLSQNRLVD